MEDNLNIEVLNREIIEAITDADDGIIKSASTAGSNMIRRRIREDGFSRNILPPKTLTQTLVPSININKAEFSENSTILTFGCKW